MQENLLIPLGSYKPSSGGGTNGPWQYVKTIFPDETNTQFVLDLEPNKSYKLLCCLISSISGGDLYMDFSKDGTNWDNGNKYTTSILKSNSNSADAVTPVNTVNATALKLNVAQLSSWYFKDEIDIMNGNSLFNPLIESRCLMLDQSNGIIGCNQMCGVYLDKGAVKCRLRIEGSTFNKLNGVQSQIQVYAYHDLQIEEEPEEEWTPLEIPPCPAKDTPTWGDGWRSKSVGSFDGSHPYSYAVDGFAGTYASSSGYPLANKIGYANITKTFKLTKVELTLGTKAPTSYSIKATLADKTEKTLAENTPIWEGEEIVSAFWVEYFCLEESGKNVETRIYEIVGTAFEKVEATS